MTGPRLALARALALGVAWAGAVASAAAQSPASASWGAVAASASNAAPTAGGEREALVAERERLRQRFEADEAACQGRFAVNACVDGVRRTRREALRPVHERLLALDAADRQERALSRQAQRTREAQSARSAPTPLWPVEQPTSSPASASAVNPRARTVTEATEAAQTSPRPHQAQEQQRIQEQQRAQERAQANARRQQAYQVLQADIARRQAEHAANPRRSAPLPTASSAAQR